MLLIQKCEPGFIKLRVQSFTRANMEVQRFNEATLVFNDKYFKCRNFRVFHRFRES